MNSFCLVVLPLVLFKTEGKKRTKSGKWGQILALTRTKVGIWRQELVEDRTRDQIEPKVGHTRDISWTWDRMWTKSGGPTLTWSTAIPSLSKSVLSCGSAVSEASPPNWILYSSGGSASSVVPLVSLGRFDWIIENLFENLFEILVLQNIFLKNIF